VAWGRSPEQTVVLINAAVSAPPLATMASEPYRHNADDGPTAWMQYAIWLKCSKPSRLCQSRLFHYINLMIIWFTFHLKIRFFNLCGSTQSSHPSLSVFSV